MCGAVRPTASQCVHTVVPSGNVAPLVARVPLFFKAFIFSDKILISCCSLATMSNEIARPAANYTGSPLFSAICVAAAAILSKYPSIESII